ncbi:MAG: hypothetical protein R3C32_09625 [Chloroflexota bacterium]
MARDMTGDPLAAALDRVGDRWSLLLVDEPGGPRRFTDLSAAIGGSLPTS